MEPKTIAVFVAGAATGACFGLLIYLRRPDIAMKIYPIIDRYLFFFLVAIAVILFLIFSQQK